MRRHVYLSGLVVALFGLGVARGQGPAGLPPVADGGFSGPAIANNAGNNRGPANNAGADVGEHTNAPRPDGGQPSGTAGGPPVYGPGLSEWITYPRGCGCCGPVGKHGPIAMEVYARTGVSWMTGGGVVGDNGRAGFDLGGGLRTLLYDQPDRAWVVDTGLRSTWHDIIGAPAVPLNAIRTTQNGPLMDNVPVTPSSVHYSLVNLSIGREYYVWGGPDCGWDAKLRVGWDAGGLYGTSKMVFYEIRHRTDVVGGFQFALHADLEVPTGCCIFFAGLRAEYSAVFSDILQRQNDADVQLIGLLANFGLRF